MHGLDTHCSVLGGQSVSTFNSLKQFWPFHHINGHHLIWLLLENQSLLHDPQSGNAKAIKRQSERYFFSPTITNAFSLVLTLEHIMTVMF